MPRKVYLDAQDEMLDLLRQQNELLRQLSIDVRLQSFGENRTLKLVAPTYEVQFYLPDVATDELQRWIFDSGNFYEIRLLEKAAPHIPDNASVLDVGANIGNHTLYFLKVCNARRVTCFEPQRRVYDTLVRNLELNGADNAETLNVAVGATEGRVKPLPGFKPRNLGGTAFAPSEQGSIPCVSLDDVVKEQVDFIKIDVEGMQAEVLKGAWGVIDRYRPPLWIESRPGTEAHEYVSEQLSSRGYRATLLSRKNHLFLTK